MAWTFDTKFQTFMNWAIKAERMDDVNDGFKQFLEDLEELLSQYPDRYKVSWNGEYETAFQAWQTREIRAGIGVILEGEVWNHADHAAPLSEGSTGNDVLKSPPASLQEWVRDKLNVDKKGVYPVALAIFRAGQHHGDNSVVLNLPPEGNSGYDPILHANENGDMQRLTDEFARNYGRKLKQIYEFGG